MDRNYDAQAAAARLEELALDRFNSAHSDTQLSRITSVTARYEAVSTGRFWSLVLRNTNEELVASFQGIIVKKDLPPFTEKLGKTSSHVKYLRQSVSVSGFETATFKKAVNAIAEVHSVLGRAVGINNVLECGMIGVLDDMQVVELSNRFFKPRQGSTANDEVILSPDIDPFGYLAKAASSAGLYHSEENSIQYFEREGSHDGDYKYKDAKPLMFGVGDIVEIQASFVIFPLKEGKYKSAMILRGLTFLDGSFTQARIKKLITFKAPTATHTVMKRRVGYGDEVMSSTRAKIARMDIDDQHTTRVGEDNTPSQASTAELGTKNDNWRHLSNETLD